MPLQPRPIAHLGSSGDAVGLGLSALRDSRSEGSSMTCSPANQALAFHAPPWVDPWTGPQPELRTEPRTELSPMAGKSHLRELVRALGADASDVREPVDGAPITLWRARQGATLLHEGAPTQALYVLRSGSLKCIRTLEDGHELVLSFAQPGEVFGFEALHCGHQPTGVVALEYATVFALPLQELRALRQQCAVLDHALQVALSRQLARAAGAAETMAAVGADARLARFLLGLSLRMAEAGQSPRRLRLSMGRRDIASLLGLAHETVSRTFSLLADAGLVKVVNREVEILDFDGLRMRGRSTRRPIETASGHARQAGAARAPAAPQEAWFPRPVALAA